MAIGGRLAAKWRIFRSHSEYPVEKNSLICDVAARLRNFVIDNVKPVNAVVWFKKLTNCGSALAKVCNMQCLCVCARADSSVGWQLLAVG